MRPSRLTAKITQVANRKDLLIACRALDRVLIAGHYLIPHWYSPKYHIAHTSRLRFPSNLPTKSFSGSNFLFFSWLAE